MSDGLQVFDAIIIGSGLYGIQAARYYLEIHPETRLIIIESDNVVGGTWSSKRMYSAFWTQTVLGMAEFSDQPMRRPPTCDLHYDFFPAKHVTEYLESYIDSHKYGGRSLRDRIRFFTSVQQISRKDSLWHLSLDSNTAVVTGKLIDATGMTSLSYTPTLSGQTGFSGLRIHHKEFGQYEDLIFKNSSIQKVAVIGGAKSAADVAYACAKAGKDVHWIIRPDGAGPAAFLSPEGSGMYKNSDDAFYNRLVSTFLPSPFNEKTWLYRFLQQTNLGIRLLRIFWDGVDRKNRRIADYGRREGKAMRFGDLEPDTQLFWQNDSSGINQRPDFFATIASKVRVYRQAIDRLTATSIEFSDTNESNRAGEGKQTLPVDVIIYCTGWVPTSPHFSSELAAELGLSQALPTHDVKETSNDETDAADESFNGSIGTQFPLLGNPPRSFTTKPALYSPFRLHKAVAPLSDLSSHSIVLLGKLVVGNNFRVAEAQALWAVAYLDGHITPSTSDAVTNINDQHHDFGAKAEEEVNKTVAWCRRRYLDKGRLGSWFFFDAISYSDMLLAQIGLKSHRGKGWFGWFRDLFAPCRAKDMKDLADEYKKLYPREGRS